MSSPRVDDVALLFEYDVAGDRWSWSTGLRQLHGLSDGDVPTTQVILDRMVEEHRAEMTQRFQQHLVTPGPYTCMYAMHDGRGRLRRLRYVGHAEADGGEVTRLFGFVVDITDMLREHAAEAIAGAVEHRAVIEQAKGAIMLCFGIDEEAAFQLLRTYSSRSNTKLAVLAEQIAHRLAEPRYSSSDPRLNLMNVLASIAPVGHVSEAGPRRGSLSAVPAEPDRSATASGP